MNKYRITYATEGHMARVDYINAESVGEACEIFESQINYEDEFDILSIREIQE